MFSSLHHFFIIYRLCIAEELRVTTLYNLVLYERTNQLPAFRATFQCESYSQVTRIWAATDSRTEAPSTVMQGGEYEYNYTP